MGERRVEKLLAVVLVELVIMLVVLELP